MFLEACSYLGYKKRAVKDKIMITGNAGKRRKHEKRKRGKKRKKETTGHSETAHFACVRKKCMPRRHTDSCEKMTLCAPRRLFPRTSIA